MLENFCLGTNVPMTVSQTWIQTARVWYVTQLGKQSCQLLSRRYFERRVIREGAWCSYASVFCKSSFTIFKTMAETCSVFSCKRRNGERSCITKGSENLRIKLLPDVDTAQSIYPEDTMSTSQHVGQPESLFFFCCNMLTLSKQICTVLNNVS